MLNPELYYALIAAFGKDSVRIKRENETMTPNYVRYTDVDGSVRYRIVKDYSGEEYNLNCPFCGDTRHRLYINYRWAFYDSITKSRNLWLARCWNEECLSIYENRMILFDTVFGGKKTPSHLLNRSDDKSLKDNKIPKPGVVIPLAQLMKKASEHIAIRYLQDRWLDPLYLSRKFNVGYCLDSEIADVCGRIVVPVVEGGKMIGWQARYVGTPTRKGVPKWYTARNFSTGKHPYNFERACKHGTMVITEGAADVWGFGAQAIGLFGKSISRTVLDRIRAEFCGESVVVLLDPKLSKDHKPGRPHHIEAAVSMLQQISRLKDKVLPVYLPEHLDPGSADRTYMRKLVYYRAQQNSINVNLNEVGGTLPLVESELPTSKVLHHLTKVNPVCLRLSTR